MKNARRLPFLRGLTVQLFFLTVLPLTLLLLVIAFGSVSLHQKDMRALVGTRDERAVRSAAATLDSELHHRKATIASMVVLAEASPNPTFQDLVAPIQDLSSDFDGGVAFLRTGAMTASTGQTPLWKWVIDHAGSLALASPYEPGPLISNPFQDPSSQRYFVVISAYIPSRAMVVAGAFSPASLARQTLTATYPADSQTTVYLADRSRQLLFASGAPGTASLPADHPGLTEALAGQTGTHYVSTNGIEHVVAYSPIASTGWALITEEDWQAVSSPSLRLTQMAPLVLVPAFVLALLALWFGARQIVQPLQRLEAEAAALAWGDFGAIQKPVGGISEVQHLQLELTEMARKVQAAQEGLHDYIGAITAAQEEERVRLARELHDDTIQAIIALKQRVQLAQKAVKTEAGHKALTELEALAEQTIENVRRLTRALRPIYLEDLGLVTALEMLAREGNQANHLEVDFRQSGQERRLPRETELALYRIAQEALNNVIHHAQAQHATVKIAFDKEIVLEVADDGIGFRVPKSPTDFAPSGHFGLLGMRERADLIGARLEVQSDAGRGTRLSVRLPSPSSKSQKKRER